MSVFSLDIDPKDSDGADGIDVVNRRILEVVAKKTSNGLITKSELARRLGVDRSTVSRLLRGNQNLTARSIGEILGAMDCTFDLVVTDHEVQNSNIRNLITIEKPSTTSRTAPNFINLKTDSTGSKDFQIIKISSLNSDL
jgi:transcriptional regulator with XRE-family HTH domain